ncbi:MAG: hypothetical protein CM1200mP30_22830 [Pseudomonadota bacterium]|nr:MAG: hypothetical protein CM1200mP30_22830 [Pseudomonadota bacterium]
MDFPWGTSSFFNDRKSNKRQKCKSKYRENAASPFVLEEGKVLIYPYELRYSQNLKGQRRCLTIQGSLNFDGSGVKEFKEELKQYKNYELWALQDKMLRVLD